MPHDRSCSSKKRYRDEGVAISVAGQVFRRGRGIMRPYSCSFCGGWHLTKQPVSRYAVASEGVSA